MGGTPLAVCPRCEVTNVTLRIEEKTEEGRIILHLSGRMQSTHLGELRAQIRHKGSPALDLHEVTLVDVGAVHFLSLCESDGIDLLHCAPYIREWMGRERNRRS